MADETTPPSPNRLSAAAPTRPGVRPGRGTRRLVRVVWTLFFLGVSLFLAYPLLIKSNFLFLFGKSPSLEELENPKVEQASEVYTADGVLLGRYFRENRSPVPLNQMSP
jgi:penicillin-binding protein 1A